MCLFRQELSRHLKAAPSLPKFHCEKGERPCILFESFESVGEDSLLSSVIVTNVMVYVA